MRELALEVLGEVPDQFVDYQTMMASTPDLLYNPKSATISQNKPQNNEDEQIQELPDEENIASPERGKFTKMQTSLQIGSLSEMVVDETALLKQAKLD